MASAKQAGNKIGHHIDAYLSGEPTGEISGLRLSPVAYAPVSPNAYPKFRSFSYRHNLMPIMPIRRIILGLLERTRLAPAEKETEPVFSAKTAYGEGEQTWNKATWLGVGFLVAWPMQGAFASGNPQLAFVHHNLTPHIPHFPHTLTPYN